MGGLSFFTPSRFWIWTKSPACAGWGIASGAKEVLARGAMPANQLT